MLAEYRAGRYAGGVNAQPQILHVVEAAQKLSDAELRHVLEILSDELKHRYKLANQIAVMALKDSDWVETIVSAKKLPLGAKGHIVELRREHVEVHFPDHGMFTVSATMLRRIDRPPGVGPKPEPGA